MKKEKLKNLNVQEMNVNEMKEVKGGFEPSMVVGVAAAAGVGILGGILGGIVILSAAGTIYIAGSIINRIKYGYWKGQY